MEGAQHELSVEPAGFSGRCTGVSVPLRLSDQCKEIEENNKMGKTRDLFKKIRDTKGIFHAKMGSFHSNPKERQCQRMLKLLHNCTHLTCEKDLESPS